MRRTALLVVALVVAAAVPCAAAAAPSCFGADRGAASVDRAAHEHWARGRTVEDLQAHLDAKIDALFACSAVGVERLAKAFAELATITGRYARSAQCRPNPGGSSTDGDS